ncbi:MAG: sugar phosphate nucleotidyltransferase [Alphaproteobacteria bacterium]|nr:MAG: hypothetical protein B6I23_00390 [Rickettsiaceae bacterium 4572_127]
MTNLQFIVLLSGKSTRNYPHSKGLPHKALLPLGDFHCIDFIMKDIYNAGGRNITFVVPNDEVKKCFEQCFVREPEIEEKFKKKNDQTKLDLLNSVYLPDDINLNFVIQKEPLGTGHAVAIASNPNEPVAMILPDDVIISTEKKHPYTRAVEEFHKTNSGNVIIGRPVKNPSRWGIIEDGFYIEKPKESKSNLSGISMFIFDKKTVENLKTATEKMSNGETQDGMYGTELAWANAINVEAKKEETQKIRPIPFQKNDVYLDCGTIEGYEKSLLYTLLNNSKFKEENKKFMKKVLNEN